MSQPLPLFLEVDDLPERAAVWLAESLKRVIADEGRCRFALSGGKTTGPIYRALTKQDVPWEQVDFFFADERCVPPDHPESNHLLAEETLFRPLGIKSERVFRMEGEREDRDAAARDYEQRLPRQLDLVVLGMGEDGHTASLFPGSTALEEKERRVLAVVGPKPPPWRLTLTLPVFLGARLVLGVIGGAGKRDIVRRILEGEDLPAARVKNAVWMMDRAAAGS